MRPLVWLGVTGFGFFHWYQALVGPAQIKAAQAGKIVDALLTFTATSSLPFLGVSRLAGGQAADTLYGKPLGYEIYLATAAHGIVTTILLFLLALALRNHLKVK